MLRLAIVAIVMCGCAEQDDAPLDVAATCTAAVGDYYAAGCTYWVEAGGGQSVPMPANSAARMCEAASESIDCAYAADALLLCAQRAGAPNCGCGDQLSAVLWCR